LIGAIVLPCNSIATAAILPIFTDGAGDGGGGNGGVLKVIVASSRMALLQSSATTKIDWSPPLSTSNDD